MTPKPMRLLFLLPAGTNRFLAMLGQLIAHSRSPARALQRPLPGRLSSRASIRNCWRGGSGSIGDKVDGIAFMALEHPAVREAVNMLAERGVPTVTLISDIRNARRAAYVGLDNRSAGRTAGYLIARFIGPRPAKVAMIAGSLSYRAHEEREMGFLHLFEELFPADRGRRPARRATTTPSSNYRQTRMLLGQHPDLAGIYNIGGARRRRRARAEGNGPRARRRVRRPRPDAGYAQPADRRHDGRGHHPESAEHDDELRRASSTICGPAEAPCTASRRRAATSFFAKIFRNSAARA